MEKTRGNKMKRILNATVLSTLMLSAFATQAVQRDITVTATVDPAVDITLADGSALPSAVTMDYNVITGLQPITKNVKLWSNSTSKNLTIALANSPTLSSSSSTSSVPLTVKFNGSALTTTATTLTYANYFPNGTANGSLAFPLVIAPTTAGVLTDAGSYTGTVSLIVQQATTSS